MPRSSKAPPLPPEPDINELIQNDVTRIKRLLGLDVNRLALGSEVEGIVESGPFGSADFTITGVNVIEFVNVSTSIGPSQGGSGFPAQVVGLTVTPHAGSDTQLDLAWTAITAPDFNYYNVYRGITSGFVVDSSSEIAQPVTNSYNNTGLSPGTTYYYRVSVTNDAELEGTPSSEVSRATTGSIGSSLWLPLNNSLADSSGNGNTVAGTGVIFGTPGKFGTHFAILNNSTTTLADSITVSPSTSTALDFTSGFSYSFWFYQTTAGTGILVSKMTDSSNYVTIQDSFGTLWASVKQGGTEYYSNQVGSLALNTWYHVVVTYDSVAHVVSLYKDKVLATTTISTSYNVASTTLIIGNRSTLDLAFKGRIDEFQYFKGVVLTQTQVNNLFSTNAP